MRGTDGKTVGRQLGAGEVGEVRRELEAYHPFAELSEAIVAVNEAICQSGGVSALPEQDPPAGTDGQEEALQRGSGKTSRPR